MKKLFLIAGLALMSMNMNAQEGLQGTWWVAGQVSFGSEKTGDVKSTSNMILPINELFFEFYIQDFYFPVLNHKFFAYFY